MHGKWAYESFREWRRWEGRNGQTMKLWEDLPETLRMQWESYGAQGKPAPLELQAASI